MKNNELITATSILVTHTMKAIDEIGLDQCQHMVKEVDSMVNSIDTAEPSADMVVLGILLKELLEKIARQPGVPIDIIENIYSQTSKLEI